MYFALVSSAHAQATSEGGRLGASPRAAVTEFLLACRTGEWELASRYLDVPGSDVGKGPELARRFKSVLDRHLWIDPAALSNQASGDPNDDLPSQLEEVGRIPAHGAVSTPVRLVHRPQTEPAWVFTSTTTNHIDAWYAVLPQRWLLEHLPAPLLRPGPAELLWWQWLALPLLAAFAWLLGAAGSRLLRRVLLRVAARTRTQWDDALLSRTGAPLTLVGTIAVFTAGLGWLTLYAPAEALAERVLRVAFLAGVFWMLARCVDVAAEVVVSSSWGSRAAAGSLVRLGSRVAKVAVAALAVVALLSAWGYSVASLLAGLGIGGLAVALAAQKTVENLFGAFSIGVDQPFREGDFVKIEDFVGTVERIGLRSTRIRTLDRTIVTLPNGKLADMRLESFTARDRIRLACTLGLVYETRPAQLRAVVAGLTRVLRAQPKIWPDAVVVKFVGFGDFSLNVDVMAWFTTSDWNEFQAIREEVLLAFMEVVEQAGSGFAFPTQTLHLVGAGTPDPERDPGLNGSGRGHHARSA